MKNVVYYIFILIALLVILAYYRGFSTNVQSVGGVVNSMILFLSGRNANGEFENYPQ